MAMFHKKLTFQFYWLIDWLIDWLTDWMIDWSIDWLIGWLIDWFYFSNPNSFFVWTSVHGGKCWWKWPNWIRVHGGWTTSTNFPGEKAKTSTRFVVKPRMKWFFFFHIREYNWYFENSWNSGGYSAQSNDSLHAKPKNVYDKDVPALLEGIKYIENNTWVRGNMKFIFECSTQCSTRYLTSERSERVRYRDWTREDKFHISKLPCIILFII